MTAETFHTHGLTIYYNAMYKNFLVNFHKGLRQKGSPRFFDDGECSVAQDCYFDEVGNIFSRKFINTVREYDYAIKTIAPYNGDLIVALSDGSLYNGSAAIVSSGMGANKLSNVVYNDVLYLGAKRYDGTNLHDTGNAAPATAPTPAATNADVSDCNSAWTASANVTASLDEHDYKENLKSVKLAIVVGFATGVIAYDDITSIDLSSYTHIGLWVKANQNVNSGVLELVLDNTAACASPLETIDLPALSINSWKWCVLELSDPSLLTAIISVGLNANSDPGIVTVRLDRIIAMTEGELDGEYYYKYTYVDSNGKESGASAVSAAVNPKEEPVGIGVTASAVSKVSYINLYRLGGTLTDWYYVTQVANTTQTIADDNADNDLSTLFDASDNDAMPAGLTYLTEHYERIIGAKTTAYLNSVLYTVGYEPEYWGEDLNQQYLISNKDACTGLLSWGRYVIFCKSDKIFVLEGSEPSSWHKRKSDSSYGNLAPWALTFYKVPIFINYFGLYFFNGNNEFNFSEIIKDFFIENKSYLSAAISCIYDDKLYLTINDKVLVFDFILKIFYTYDLTLTEMRYSDGVIYAGNGTNLVKLEQNTGSDTVNMQIKSKAYPLHDVPNNIGSLKNIIVNIDTKSKDVSLKTYIDEVLFQTMTLNTSSMTRLRKSFNSNAKGKHVEFEFVYSGTKQIEIQSPLVVNPIEQV